MHTLDKAGRPGTSSSDGLNWLWWELESRRESNFSASGPIDMEQQPFCTAVGFVVLYTAVQVQQHYSGVSGVLYGLSA